MEKRRYERIKKRLSVKFGASEATAIGFTSDIASIGMFIRTKEGGEG